jgi:hypothetical protein
VRSPASIAESQHNIDSGPSTNISTRLLRVLPFDHAHEQVLLKDGQHPISELEIDFEQ